MAFPSVRSDNPGVQATNANPWTLTYPASIEAGDLLLVNIGRDGSTGTGSITDFTLLFNSANGTACRGLTFVKVADGTESGNFSYSVGASEQGTWRVVSYQDWWGTLSTGVEVSGPVTGASTTPDPPNLDPTNWATEDTLWRAMFAHDDGRPTVSAYPTNYDLSQNNDTSNGSGGAGMGGASRQNAVSAENPGTFTRTGTGSSSAWVAWTIAIRPAAPAIVPPLQPAMAPKREDPYRYRDVR